VLASVHEIDIESWTQSSPKETVGIMQRVARKRLRRVFAWVSVVALLDVTTSAIPSFIDVFGPVRGWPAWVRVCEVLIALTLLEGLPARVRSLRKTVELLPGSRFAHWLMGALVMGNALMVFFRSELFPFSNVGMFSAVPPASDRFLPRETESVVFVEGTDVLPVATIREGSPLVAEFATDWDYKTGWTLYMFGASDSRALAFANEAARRNGFDRAARARVIYDPLSGRTLGIEPIRRGVR
jgi:hypothetical protein